MTTTEHSFLAPPLQVSDWRLVLLHAAASDAGLLQALPGRPDELAGRLDLDEHAVTVVLEALSLFGVVDRLDDGRFGPGAASPSPDGDAALYHHARSLKRWALALDDRLRGTIGEVAGPPREPARWLDSMAVGARRTGAGAIDACLARVPGARTALDLGGGHGEYALELARRGLAVTMQDRAAMIDIARDRGVLEAAGVSLFTGDFFEVLADGPFDLVLCSGVTNTLGPERNVELFRRVRSILAPDGRLVIQTLMRDRDPAAALFGIQMLVNGNGGDAHPERSYREWMAAAGYDVVEVIDVGSRSQLFARLPVAT